MDIILGSSSPRRQELLAGLGIAHRIIKPLVEEKRQDGESAIPYALRNSALKAQWVREHLRQQGLLSRDHLIISADTIVVLDEHILEKPTDQTDARRMLGMLADRTHRVVTGLYLLKDGPDGYDTHEEVVLTEVTLKPLALEEIAAYVATGEPMDKSGSYAIQGRGGYMVSRINGSYSNVVGLPMAELIDAMSSRFGYQLW